MEDDEGISIFEIARKIPVEMPHVPLASSCIFHIRYRVLRRLNGLTFSKVRVDYVQISLRMRTASGP
jgi:hypothetical protein